MWPASRIRAWDSRGHIFRTEYDPLRRPLRSFVTGADPTNPNQELLTERLVYGEQHPQAELRNLRGKLYLHLDQAGSVTTEAHDFKGNPLRASRRLTNGTQYKQAVDWRAVDADHIALPIDATALLDPVALAAVLAPRLEADVYTSRTTYDAINRPVTLTTPHTAAMPPSIIRPGYNEANLLERVDANLRGAATATPFVTNIHYNAKGQRMLIQYGNGVRTMYDYDPETFRLTHLQTLRGTDRLQDLFYTYDPVGNITHIRDDAQQTIYFNGQAVAPHNDYMYDALYRLIDATGREHVGQTANDNPSLKPHYDFTTRRAPGLAHPHDGLAMRNYTERYEYDTVGNILKWIHAANGGSWTRDHMIATDSNRLVQTSLPASNFASYDYDAHGNMIRMPHLRCMKWDYKDQLQATSQQVVNNGTPETTYYVYDLSGQRVRKVTEARRPPDKRPREGWNASTWAASRFTGSTRTMAPPSRWSGKHCTSWTTSSASPWWRRARRATILRRRNSSATSSATTSARPAWSWTTRRRSSPTRNTPPTAARHIRRCAARRETPKRYRYTGKERDEESGFVLPRGKVLRGVVGKVGELRSGPGSWKRLNWNARMAAQSYPIC